MYSPRFGQTLAVQNEMDIDCGFTISTTFGFAGGGFAGGGFADVSFGGGGFAGGGFASGGFVGSLLGTH